MAIPKAEFIAMMTAAHVSYAELAARINRSGRLVQRWVSFGEVPDNYEPIVRRALAVDTQERPVPGPLSAFSDYALLDEIARRMHLSRTKSEDSGWINADPPDTV